MSAIDRLLDDYEAVAAAARRLLESRFHHLGEHGRGFEEGQCLKCGEACIQAEADLHRALAKVAPAPFRPSPCEDSGNGSRPGTQQATKDFHGSPAEYLWRFFSELERLKRRSGCDVSHAIGFCDGQMHILMSVGDFRERVYIQDLDRDPTSAAQDVFLQWKTTPRVDEQIE